MATIVNVGLMCLEMTNHGIWGVSTCWRLFEDDPLVKIFSSPLSRQIPRESLSYAKDVVHINLQHPITSYISPSETSATLLKVLCDDHMKYGSKHV